MPDPLFNTLVFGIDAIVLLLVAKSERPRTVFAAVVAGSFAALIAVGLFERAPFHLVRLLAFLVFLHLPVLFLGVAWIAGRRSRAIVATCLTLALGVWVVAGYAFLIEPRRLELTSVELHSAKLSSPLRIAVVADLQADRIGAHERRALKMVLDAEPDLILMPGDYLHIKSTLRRQLEHEFGGLLREIDFGAPLGAFATRGNVEYDDWPDMFDESRVTALTDSATIAVGEVELTGLDLWDSFDTHLTLRGSERFKIVFGHGPDFSLGNIEADLLVAGHTHGGQIQLPLVGPILTLSKVPRAWAAGVTDLGDGRTLIVSRGIGMERGWAPRLRFLCRPEVVIVDILPESDRRVAVR